MNIWYKLFFVTSIITGVLFLLKLHPWYIIVGTVAVIEIHAGACISIVEKRKKKKRGF